MVDQNELAFALAHFKRRALAQDQAQRLVSEARDGSLPPRQSRIERESHATRSIKIIKALREAGNLSFPEYVALAGFFALNIVHEDRLLDAHYAAVLGPIEASIGRIEQEHGLTTDEFWLRDEGPPEWQELNTRYEDAVQLQEVAVLRELGLDDLADILESDRDEFQELWSRGSKIETGWFSQVERLERLVRSYRKESNRAEEIGAYQAAVAMRGAVLEGLLLLRCLNRPGEVEQALKKLTARHRPNNLPVFWSLDQLIKVSRVAGWLPTLSVGNSQLDISIYAELVKNLRNMLHPGRRLRDVSKEVDHEDLADARAALVLIESVLEEIDEGS